MWLLIVGSPRVRGVSARVAQQLQHAIEGKYPTVNLQTFSVAETPVMGCNGCEYCKLGKSCNIDDAGIQFLQMVREAERIIMVTPVYFAGLPSQCKALIDRLQPFFWQRQARKQAFANAQPTHIEHQRESLPLTGQLQAMNALPIKRPLSLFVVGEGNDPHGFEPLVTSVKSAFALADYYLASVTPLVGARPRLDVQEALASIEQYGSQYITYSETGE